jgi:response regulator NasT
MAVFPLHIAVAMDDGEERASLLCLLQALGHEAIAVGTGRELSALCSASRPALILAAARLPDMDGVQASQPACAERMVPVILLSDGPDDETLEKARQDHVFGYLAGPITEQALVPAIRLTLHRFASLEVLRREACELRQALEERKVIEQAKGILTHRLRLEEPEVVCRLRKLATNRRCCPV